MRLRAVVRLAVLCWLWLLDDGPPPGNGEPRPLSTGPTLPDPNRAASGVRAPTVDGKGETPPLVSVGVPTPPLGTYSPPPALYPLPSGAVELGGDNNRDNVASDPAPRGEKGVVALLLLAAAAEAPS